MKRSDALKVVEAMLDDDTETWPSKELLREALSVLQAEPQGIEAAAKEIVQYVIKYPDLISLKQHTVMSLHEKAIKNIIARHVPPTGVTAEQEKERDDE